MRIENDFALWLAALSRNRSGYISRAVMDSRRSPHGPRRGSLSFPAKFSEVVSWSIVGAPFRSGGRNIVSTGVLLFLRGVESSESVLREIRIFRDGRSTARTGSSRRSHFTR